MFFFLRHAKFFSAFAIFAILAIVLTAVFYIRSADDPWKEFKTKHGKDYEEFKDGGKEDARRKQIFLTTDAKIKKHNSQKNVTYQLGHNKFSDMTAEELTKYLGAVEQHNVTSSSASKITFNMTDRTLPATLDYSNDPCMPAVKNQGGCGSCWAFSAIAPMEFAYCKIHCEPVVLSEQQLVDCDFYNNGCGGGRTINAWDYLQNTAGGSTLQYLYPYIADQDTCQEITYIAARVSGYGSLSDPNVENIQTAFQMYGLISVDIKIDKDSFAFYRSGVYSNSACDNSENYHAIVVVGWGTDGGSGLDYWIVRNSWGSDWGMDGYILIQRGVNRCQIESNAAVVSVV